jgi:hypothetical protein
MSDENKKKYARYSMLPGAAAGADAPDYGKTQLGIAMAKAVVTINAKEGAGKMKAANAAMYRAKIDGLKPLIGKDEDAGLLQAAQIIGSINRSL